MGGPAIGAPMSSLGRPRVPTSTDLLLRILERPGLIAAVRDLPGEVLGALIDRIGLEDAGELVALASQQQLERIFDDDLWRPQRAGGDETFRPERFALWLRVMMDAGDDVVVRRLCELPIELVVLGVHRLVLVLESDVAAAREDRRAGEGFVSPADARAFLALARRGGGDERDPITRAYLRELRQRPGLPVPARGTRAERRHPGTASSSGKALAARAAGDLAALLRDAAVLAPAAPGGPLLAPLGSSDDQAGHA